MYVSSYNTYIHPNTSERSAKTRFDKQSSEGKKFDSNFSDNKSYVTSKNSNLPIDYIAKSNIYNNKNELEFQTQQLQEDVDTNLKETKNTLQKFSEPNSIVNAKSAYESNSIMFSLIKRPHASLDQTPKTDENLPKNLQEAKEDSIRHIMVNTYLQNDRYYQITA